MGQCNVDHSPENVRSKFESQADYLPAEVKTQFTQFFAGEHSQEILNEVFHLLKKYDLASPEERERRDRQLMLILQNT